MSAEDVRQLHVPFGIYDKCDHVHKDESAPGVVDVPDIGLTCEKALIHTVCRECDTDDGEVNEFTYEGTWPCRTIKALEKP